MKELCLKDGTSLKLEAIEARRTPIGEGPLKKLLDELRFKGDSKASTSVTSLLIAGQSGRSIHIREEGVEDDRGKRV